MGHVHVEPTLTAELYRVTSLSRLAKLLYKMEPQQPGQMIGKAMLHCTGYMHMQGCTYVYYKHLHTHIYIAKLSSLFTTTRHTNAWLYIGVTPLGGDSWVEVRSTTLDGVSWWRLVPH